MSGEAGSIPLRTEKWRCILNDAAEDGRFDPSRLQDAVDNRFHGIGIVGWTAGNNYIRTELLCKIQGC